jgi:hypothetical protein
LDRQISEYKFPKMHSTTQSYNNHKILTYEFADFVLKDQRLWTPWPLELIVCFIVTTDGHLFRYEHINTSPQAGFKATVGPMQSIIFDTPHMILFKKNALQFDSSNNLFAY